MARRLVMVLPIQPGAGGAGTAQRAVGLGQQLAAAFGGRGLAEGAARRTDPAAAPTVPLGDGDDVRFAVLDSDGAVPGDDGRLVEHGDVTILVGPDGAIGGRGSYSMAWRPEGGGWELRICDRPAAGVSPGIAADPCAPRSPL